MGNRTFVLAWVDAYQKSLGLKAVASKMNMSTASASAKANVLRSKGVKLPHMRSSGRAQDVSVESLNELIASKIN